MDDAETVVFPAELVRDRCTEAVGTVPRRTAILPQGIAMPPIIDEARRQAVRAALRLPNGSNLALGMGYADLRKGFDLFLQAWRTARATGQGPALRLGRRGSTRRPRRISAPRSRPPRQPAPSAISATATMRPTCCAPPTCSCSPPARTRSHRWRSRPWRWETPVVAFDETGGHPRTPHPHRRRLLRAARGHQPHGACRPTGWCARRRPERRATLARDSRAAFRFEAYSAALIALAKPNLLQVSVVVPSCDYDRYMEARLASIFAQSYPVLEVVLLDDASVDQRRGHGVPDGRRLGAPIAGGAAGAAIRLGVRPVAARGRNGHRRLALDRGGG